MNNDENDIFGKLFFEAILDDMSNSISQYLNEINEMKTKQNKLKMNCDTEDCPSCQRIDEKIKFRNEKVGKLRDIMTSIIRSFCEYHPEILN